MAPFIVRLKKGEEVLQENSLRLQRLLNDGEARNISVDVRVRNQDYDSIEVLFRNDSNAKLPGTVDNLKVIGFNE